MATRKTSAKPAKKASVQTWKATSGDDELRNELNGIASALEGDELRVLLRVARRLKFGRDRYGKLVLEKDKRNLLREAMEEILDFTVYIESLLEKESQKPVKRRGKVPR